MGTEDTPAVHRELLSAPGSGGPAGCAVHVARSSSYFKNNQKSGMFCEISKFLNVGNNLKNHCLKLVQAKQNTFVGYIWFTAASQ